MKIFKLKIVHILIICLICTGISFYAIMILVQNVRTVSVNATPVTNKKVILDAGHGLPDEGATSFLRNK